LCETPHGLEVVLERGFPDHADGQRFFEHVEADEVGLQGAVEPRRDALFER